MLTVFRRISETVREKKYVENSPDTRPRLFSLVSLASSAAYGAHVRAKPQIPIQGFSPVANDF